VNSAGREHRTGDGLERQPAVRVSPGLLNEPQHPPTREAPDPTRDRENLPPARAPSASLVVAARPLLNRHDRL